MYNVGKSVIIDLIIKYYCEIQNFDYETLSSESYGKMYDMCYELDVITLLARLGELYEILNK